MEASEIPLKMVQRPWTGKEAAINVSDYSHCCLKDKNIL